HPRFNHTGNLTGEIRSNRQSLKVVLYQRSFGSAVACRYVVRGRLTAARNPYAVVFNNGIPVQERLLPIVRRAVAEKIGAVRIENRQHGGSRVVRINLDRTSGV